MINDDAATLTNQQAALARQFITRTNPSLRSRMISVSSTERHLRTSLKCPSAVTIFNTRRGLLSMHLDTQVFNFRAQYLDRPDHQSEPPSDAEQILRHGFPDSDLAALLLLPALASRHQSPRLFLHSGWPHEWHPGLQWCGKQNSSDGRCPESVEQKHKNLGSENQLVKTQYIAAVGCDRFIQLIQPNCAGIQT